MAAHTIFISTARVGCSMNYIYHAARKDEWNSNATHIGLNLRMAVEYEIPERVELSGTSREVYLTAKTPH